MKFIDKILIVCFLFFLSSLALTANAQNLVVNGGFDTGNTTGWSLVTKGLVTGMGYLNGSIAFYGRPDSSVAPPTNEQISLSQSINLIGGKTYSFSAYTLSSIGYTGYNYYDGGTVSVTIGGTPIASHSFGLMWWYQSLSTTLQGSFTAPSTGSYEIRIDLTANDPAPHPSIYVDNITVMPPQETLTLVTNPSGNGTFVKTPDQASYYDGSSVSVKVTPGFGYMFANWSGAIAGNPTDNPVSVVIDSNKTLTANLAPANVLVEFFDSQNIGIPGAVVQYYDRGWQNLGTTDAEGIIRYNYTGVLQKLNFRLTYNGKTIMKLNQDYKLAPVIFNASSVEVKLVSSAGTGIAGGTVEYYNAGWQSLGTTNSTGVVSITLMPGYYSFRMTYEGMTVNQNNINISTVNPVVFQTVNMDVRLEHPLVGGIPGGQVMFNTAAVPAWASFGNTDGNGNAFKELLPGVYSFQMNFQSTVQEQNNINIAVTNPVIFQPTSGTVVSFYRAQKLNSGETTNRYYGRAVDISGSYAVVGEAYGLNTSGVQTGSVKIYEKVSGTWQLQSKLYGSMSGEGFGASVAIDGNVIVVGAPNFYRSMGKVYMFRWNGSTWNQEATFSPEAYANSLFGSTVDVSGNDVIVGVPGYSYYNYDPGMGKVYWYNYNGSTWVTAGNWFGAFQSYAYTGRAVAISGNYSIVYNVNAVYIFKKSGTSWGVQQYFLRPSTTFGYTLALDGDNALIGAYLESNGTSTNSGAVYSYQRDPATDTWAQTQRITSNAPFANEMFGYSLAICGSRALIASSPTLPQPGTVYLFGSGTGSWAQEDQISAPDGVAGDQFGTSARIDADDFIVGAPGANSSTGAAYIYPPKVLVTIPKQGVPQDKNVILPAQFNLAQNYPNPFNPSTKISFTVKDANLTSLKVFNIIGEEVAVLFNGLAEPGKTYALNFNASKLASGVYIYKLQNGQNVMVKKMVLMK